MNQLKKYFLHLAWIQALAATASSLFFSEVWKLPPCILCWYQRIAMYPLVVILAVGIFRRDKNVAYYALPLAIIGFVIAAYHNFLYWNILPESSTPCIQGVSCTVKYFEWFGFVTIPFLSFVAFGVIIACLTTYLKLSRPKSSS